MIRLLDVLKNQKKHEFNLYISILGDIFKVPIIVYGALITLTYLEERGDTLFRQRLTGVGPEVG